MKRSQLKLSKAIKFLAASAVFICTTLQLSAADPLLPFAAKISDKQGVPLDGPTKTTFRIYSDPAGGSPVWTEVHNAATVTKGVLSVNLGSVSGFGPLELIEGYWLGITVGDDAEMTPRVQIPAQAIVPAGTIAPFGGDAANVPKGWMLCDGRELADAIYPKLYKAIGKAWGSPSASTFRVPDLRGLFLRGVDGSANRDPDKANRTPMATGGNTGNAVGSYQADEFKSHTHSLTTIPGYDAGGGYSGGGWAGDPIPQNTTPTGGPETRPRNAYVNYIIKY